MSLVRVLTDGCWGKPPQLRRRFSAWDLMVAEREEAPMSIVGGVDIHRKQLTFDWVDECSGTWERGRIAPADREHLAGWLTRFDVTTEVAFAFEGCTGWR